MNRRRRHAAKRRRKLVRLRQEAGSLFYPERRIALRKLWQMGASL
jgi:hypothetical protein